MCQEWKDDYIKFHSWAMDNGYSNKLTIDRIDNDKGYSPDNCRWATKKEQADNRNYNITLTFNGAIGSPEFWSKKLNIKINTIYTRKFRGWSDEKILSTPVRKHDKAVKV